MNDDSFSCNNLVYYYYLKDSLFGFAGLVGTEMEQVRSAFRNSLSARITHYLPQDCQHQGSQYVQDLMDVMKDSIKLQKGTIIDFER